MLRSTNDSRFELLSSSIAPITIAVDALKQTLEAETLAHSSNITKETNFCNINFDEQHATVWVRLQANAPAKFTPQLLRELSFAQTNIERCLDARRKNNTSPPIRFQVLASDIPGVFSLGGDLALFRECITSNDRFTLARYAQAAVSLVHSTANAYKGELTTISLIQGQAMGGGLEAALAAHVVVAERSSKMGFPEVLFNMFPGMGAYQLLSRRLSSREAEQMILSGRTYSAEELHALGVVDVLSEDGQGEAAVRRYIQMHTRQHHARQGFRRALQAATPLDLGALRRMADVWVETAMGLSERDLETIDYLLRAQERHSQQDTSQEQSDASELLLQNA